MTVPAWLANVEDEIVLSRGRPRDEQWMTPEVFQMALLDWLSEPVNRWLDTTMVHGNREARRLWARICRCYLSVAYWLPLRGLPNGAVTRVVNTAVRLNGLRLTPDPWANA